MATTYNFIAKAQPAEGVLLTQDMIRFFYIASKDGNKIHQGKKGIALGKQMVGMMGDVADSVMDVYRPGLKRVAHKAVFDKAIIADSLVQVYLPEALDTPQTAIREHDDGSYTLVVSMRKVGDREARAVTTFTYAPKTTYQRITGKELENARQTGIECVLDGASAQGVAKGIGRDISGEHVDVKDVRLLAYSLASHALAIDGSDLTELAKDHGFLPVYRQHELQFFSSYFSIGPGDEIRIITEGERAANKLVKRINKALRSIKDEGLTGEDVERARKKAFERTMAKVAVTATSLEGHLIYKGDLALTLRTPDDVLQDAQ